MTVSINGFTLTLSGAEILFWGLVIAVVMTSIWGIRRILPGDD